DDLYAAGVGLLLIIFKHQRAVALAPKDERAVFVGVARAVGRDGLLKRHRTPVAEGYHGIAGGHGRLTGVRLRRSLRALVERGAYRLLGVALIGGFGKQLALLGR